MTTEKQITLADLDEFTRAYVEAMLWSSTVEPFGMCARCGKEAPLVQHDKAQPFDDGKEWTLCGECGDAHSNVSEPPADDNYSADDLSQEAFVRIVADCEKFQREQFDNITYENCLRGGHSTAEYAGHDFWLTRNGHGAGFWDGDWQEPAGAELTKASKAMGCAFQPAPQSFVGYTYSNASLPSTPSPTRCIRVSFSAAAKSTRRVLPPPGRSDSAALLHTRLSKVWSCV